MFIYVALVFALHFTGKGKKSEKSKKDKLLSNVTVEFLMNLTTPVAVLDGNGIILWYNQKFSEDKGQMALYGTNINDLLETKLNLNHLKESLSDSNRAAEPLVASYNGIKYSIHSYKHNISFGGENLYITVWNDMTEIQRLEDMIQSRNSVVAYVYIDNFYEAGGTMLNNYRTVTAKVSTLLYEWIGTFNGIVREFERDKYIAIFDQKFLKDITESKFDILDRVRELCEKCDKDKAATSRFVALSERE